MRRLPALALVIGIVLGLLLHRSAMPTLSAAATHDVSSQSLLALELLHGLYPELVDKSLALQIDGVPASLRLRVSETGGPDPSRPVLKLTTPLLTASLTLDQDSQVERYVAEGPFLQSQKLAALNRSLRAHPEWSEAERRAALLAAGAEYGPGHEPDVEAKVRPRAWEKQVGRGARIQLQDFIWKDVGTRNNGARDKQARDNDRKDEDSRPTIGWRARLDAAGPDGRPAQYELVVEPFTGRVTSMTKVARTGRGR